MKHMHSASALLTSLVLAACASAPQAPAALVDARSTLRQAEADPAVLAHAPLELKKASDSINRANLLWAQGDAEANINSLAYVASQQARTAMAIARAKGSDAAISGAELERERTRGDLRSAEAQRAQALASSAQAMASSAQARAISSEARASSAQDQALSAQARAGLATQQAAESQQRANSAEQRSLVAQADASQAQAQTSQLQQRLTELQAKPTERGMLVTLGDVLFEFNRAEVRPVAQMSLRKLADFLQQYPQRRVLIEGHTDNVGSANYNDELSLRRAEAVDHALIGLGVAGQRVATVGYGKDYPIADNSSDTNRALNRRVEVYIADNDQPVRSRR